MSGSGSLSARHLEEQLFARWMGASLALHAGVLLVLAVTRLAEPPAPLIPPDNTIDVELLISAPMDPEGGGQKRGLPNKETFVPVAPEEPAIAEAANEPKPPPADAAVVPNPDTKVEPPKEAESLAEALKQDVPPPESQNPGLDSEARTAMAEQISRLAEEKRRKDAIAKLTGVEGLRNRSAGVGNASGDGTGDGTTGNAMGVDPQWAQALNETITPLWIVLPTLANKPLRVIVYVTLDAEGNVRDAEVRLSSGEPSLDSSAIRAVKKAKVLPLPTKGELKTVVLADGFELAFNPKGLAP